MSTKSGYDESKQLLALGFVGGVHSDPDRDDWFIARGTCRACGDAVEADALQEPFMGSSNRDLHVLVEPFRRHWQEHEMRRAPKWEVVYPIIRRAVEAAHPEDHADVMRALERAVSEKAAGERAFCARTVETYAAAARVARVSSPESLLRRVAARLRHPTAADYGLIGTLGGREAVEVVTEESETGQWPDSPLNPTGEAPTTDD